MYMRLHVDYPLFFSDCYGTSIFPTDFRKSAQTSNFMKFRPVEAELLYAAVSDRRTDGRTDVAKLILAFRDFANGTRRL